MNRSEREILLKNLPILLGEIDCSNDFLTYLASSGAITGSEKDSVWNQKLYQQDSTVHKGFLVSLLQTRVNGFTELKSALEKTNQTGALKLLQLNEGSLPSSSTEGSKMAAKIIGSEGCSFQAVMGKMLDASVNFNLISNWRRLATELGIGLTNTSSYQRQINFGNMTEIDVIEDMVHKWKSAKGSDATLEALITILESKTLDCKGVADNLRQLS